MDDSKAAGSVVLRKATLCASLRDPQAVQQYSLQGCPAECGLVKLLTLKSLGLVKSSLLPPGRPVSILRKWL